MDYPALSPSRVPGIKYKLFSRGNQLPLIRCHVFSGIIEENINVFSRPNKTMKGDGIASDNYILNLFFGSVTSRTLRSLFGYS